jgi:hypothetical protein
MDFTGLQTFPPPELPLCIMSDWGWHRYPKAPQNDAALRKTPYDTYGRPVAYATDPAGQEELFKALRQNAHRFTLGRVRFPASAADYDKYTGIRQELSLWEGVLASVFSIHGEPVSVWTLVCPDQDTLCVRIESGLLSRESSKLRVCLDFPYGSHKKSGGDFTCPERHSTEIEVQSQSIIVQRRMDDTRYTVAVRISPGVDVQFDGMHKLTFSCGRDRMELSFRFSSIKEHLILPEDFEHSRRAAAGFWETYWNEGAALDLGEAADPRAPELERRVVLSQYLSAIQCRSPRPPAETGLTCNSWYGKFHLEMHYWHCSYFAIWNRGKELEKSLGYYRDILPLARNIAAEQGYAGARWPKMCDPTGYNSPSSIGVLLVWQQPHPILLAELCYRCNPRQKFLALYRNVVVETAEFMASFIHSLDDGTAVLGPPLIPAQERFDPKKVLNPGFETEYFRYALRLANTWLTRLGEAPRPGFEAGAQRLRPPPTQDGVYIAHANCPQTFTEPVFHTDHPSMLAMLGMLPGKGIDRNTMRRTLMRVLEVWDRQSLWGWDFPLMAMTAARLNMPEEAINLLLMDTPKNTYLANGHNPQGGREDLPLYLPGNAGLLLAVGMLAGGWDDSDALGFPPDWRIRSEGFLPYI